MADLVSYTIPNLIQGVSQQPDAQRDPSQGEIQINGVSSVAEGLRKRDSSHTLNRVSSEPFGDCFIHSILRDQQEEYLAVITKDLIRVFDLDGNEKEVRTPYGLDYLSSVASAKEQIRAVSIADYTFILNTTTRPQMRPALAPSPSRPAPHEALVWVKAANYSQTYNVTVNGTKATVETAVAPVVVQNGANVENRISSEEIADTLMLALQGKLTGVASLTPLTPVPFTYFKATTLTVATGRIFSGPVASVAKISGVDLNAAKGFTYTNVPTTSNGTGTGCTLSITIGNGESNPRQISSLTFLNQGSNYRVGDVLTINAVAMTGAPSNSTALDVATVTALRATSRTNLATTTNGLGTGMTVNISVSETGTITSCTINQPGTGYKANDVIYLEPSQVYPQSAQLRVQVATIAAAPAGSIFTVSNIPTYSTTGEGCRVNLSIQNNNIVGVTIAASGNGYAVDDVLKVSPKDIDSTSTSSTQLEVAKVKSVLPPSGGVNSNVTISRNGSVLWLRSSSPITISATDARANADITTIFNEVQSFVELPTIAPTGYQVTITGDPGNKFAGYYVQFKPRAGSFGEGSWVETVSPGVEYQIDSSTMPHILVRLADGTFLFTEANGTSQSGLTVPKWGDRIAGDYESAPDPSFIGFPINDIAVYKNRLVVLADENVILSRTREFFEFFPETVTAVLDTDPIDVVASNNRVSVLRYAVPYQDELILFSGQYQFRFNAADTVLTPATAQITVLTQYEIDARVRPQQSGGGIFFCQANGQWTQIREFSVRGAGTALTADAQDLTGYVSAYLPSGVYKMTTNDISNSLFIISDKQGHKDRVYVYKWFFRGGSGGIERAQSSWSYWEFTGADQVLQVLCIRENLYCLMLYGDEVFLEVIPVMDRMASVIGAPYPLLLDRRISTTVATALPMRVSKGTYDATAKKTIWTLPFTMRAKTQAWSSYTAGAAAYNGGVLLGEADSGNTITANGDWSQADVFFGEPYNFRYRFTRFKMMRDIGGGKAAVNTMRSQIRHAKLRYHESGYFRVYAMPEHRATGTYVFDGTETAVRNARIGQVGSTYEPDTARYFEGVFTVPILSRGERCMVEIHNDTPHPCKFSTCEWVGLISGSARQMQ